MDSIYWIILGYFAIGLSFLEGIKWAKSKWKLPPLDRLAMIFVFTLWPLVILCAYVLVWREKK